MANLGFIGLGAMGSRMVKRLLDHGHSVIGFNRTASRGEPLIESGMKWAASPFEVTAMADITLMMLTNSDAVAQVMTGPRGALSGLGPDKLLIDMSTIGPDISRSLAEQVRQKGGDMIDAPVSGSIVTLERGELSVMVGGSAESFERARPVLMDLGPRVTHMGSNGQALVVKIAINLSLAAQMVAFSEGVLIAEKSGVPRDLAVKAFKESVIASPMILYRGGFVVEMPHEAWFNVDMMQKDLLLAMELGRKLGIPLPVNSSE